MREEGEAQMCLEHPVLKVSIYSKTFFSDIDSLYIALTLVQGPGKLSPLAPCLAPFFYYFPICWKSYRTAQGRLVGFQAGRSRFQAGWFIQFPAGRSQSQIRAVLIFGTAVSNSDMTAQFQAGLSRFPAGHY